MAALSNDRHLVLRNAPVKVVGPGFDTDTYRMGVFGWQFEVRHDSYEMRTDVLLKHKGLGVAAYGAMDGDLRIGRFVTETIEQSRRGFFGEHQGSNAIRIVRMGSLPGAVERVVRRAPLLDPDEAVAREIQTTPYFSDVTVRELFEEPFFASAGSGGEQLIIDQASVQEMLDEIRRRQAPEQARIRAENARRERRTNAGMRLAANVFSIAA